MFPYFPQVYFFLLLLNCTWRFRSCFKSAGFCSILSTNYPVSCSNPCNISFFIILKLKSIPWQEMRCYCWRHSSKIWRLMEDINWDPKVIFSNNNVHKYFIYLFFIMYAFGQFNRLSRIQMTIHSFIFDNGFMLVRVTVNMGPVPGILGMWRESLWKVTGNRRTLKRPKQTRGAVLTSPWW